MTPSIRRCIPRHLRILAPALALLLTGCATRPAFVDAPAMPPSTPYGIAQSVEQHLQQGVLWGGMVIEVRNYEHYSEVEILGYPLDDKQRPRLEAPDQGRFIALMAGFADPASLPKGRFVTLIGEVTGDRQGPLRGETYTWPEINVRRLHLWPQDFRQKRSHVSFAVGVGL